MTRKHNIKLNKFEIKITDQEMLRFRNWSFSYPIDKSDEPDEYHQQLILTNTLTKDQFSVVMHIKPTSIKDHLAVWIECECCYEGSISFDLEKLTNHVDTHYIDGVYAGDDSHDKTRE